MLANILTLKCGPIKFFCNPQNGFGDRVSLVKILLSAGEIGTSCRYDVVGICGATAH